MKNLFTSLAICCIVVFAAKAQTPTLTQIWETDTTLTTPESVLYDSRNNVLYVSCINGKSVPENQESFVAKVGLDGKIQQRIMTSGLNAIKGMGILGNKLYVAGFFALAEINLTTNKVVNKYEVPEAKMLNDITVDEKNQIVYVTDMRANSVWKLQQGKLEKILDGAPLKNPNGLFFENGKLLIGNGEGILFSYDTKTKNLSKFAEGMGTDKSGIDGIESDGKKGYFVTEWRGKIWHVSPDGKTSLLLDTVDKPMNTADIEYIPAKKMLLVPTFLKNKVVAYKVN
ncbi:SMP-30/gluconolactonase/LRE family protein [Emticicia sp. 17c]|uniref:SMP-30/gluconolactonase/LRE family protein n=1 Tax=Emticicia sp. 17c TaxID=3127704 RepID=UPI00301CEA7D